VEVTAVRTNMSKRTKTTFAAGLALLVAGGGGATYMASRGAGAGTAGPTVPVYYAAATVDVGTSASVALAQGSIRSKAVPPADRPVNGVTDAAQLAGRVAGTSIAAGAVVTTDMFPDPQTRIGTVVIPAGKRALAVELQPVAGIAGFAGAGDRIDVYGIVRGEPATPGVRLIFQGVEVLNVNGAGLPAAQGQPGGPNLIYLLAVTPPEAERLIYMSEFEKLYFDLVPKGEAPVKTPGAAAAGALAV
jgi:pilus assembly protein CpaB